MSGKIAVTTDFTDASRLAFGAAVTLSKKFGARLILLHVARGAQIYTPWQVAPESPGGLRRRAEERRKRLRAFASQEPAFEGTRVEPVVLEGESAEALAEYQRLEKIDVIVIATHGYSGVKLFPLGSFAAQLLHFASRPVLVYRALEGEEGKQVRFNPRRILVPYDFSPPSGRSLEVARSWARVFEASARLLTVVKPELLLHDDSVLTEEDIIQKGWRARVETQDRLEKTVIEDWQGIQTETCVRVGHPALEILREAEERSPDLIIMASRGLSLSDRLTLGSVAERTIHGAACPVLVVK